MMNEFVLDLDDVRRDVLKIEDRAGNLMTTLGLAPRIDLWLQMLLDCHAFAIRRTKEGDELATYLEVYGSLSAVAFQNAEGARRELSQGRFGNAVAVFRSLAAHNDTIRDIGLSENAARKWLELRALRIEDRSRGANRLREYFKDHQVAKRIRDRGEQPLGPASQDVGSAAVHGTPWGTQFFLSESFTEPGIHNVAYEPQYHPARVALFATWLLALLPHLSGFFLDHLQSTSMKDDKEFDELAEAYIILLQDFERIAPKYNELSQRVDSLRREMSQKNADDLVEEELRTFSKGL